jgi:hypothetical protein
MDQFFHEDVNQKSVADTIVGLQQSILKLEDAIAATGRSQALLELRLLKTARTLQEEVAQRAIEMARLNIDTATDVARATISAQTGVLRDDFRSTATDVARATISAEMGVLRDDIRSTATSVARETIASEVSVLRDDWAHELAESTLPLLNEISRLRTIMLLFGVLLLILSLAFIGSH